MDVLNVGILGTADIAWRAMAPALAADPTVRLVAVASRTQERAARFAERFGCAAVTGYDNLLRRDDLAAVYIPLPTGLHGYWVGRALAGGRHVLVEKSLASRPADAVQLAAHAAERSLVLLENFMFLRHSQHRRVRELLAGGAIGTLCGVRAEFTIPPRPAGDIRYQAALGGGALLDLGAYVLRAARLFLGWPLWVDGAFLRYAEAGGVDLDGAALLHNEHGVTAELRFGFDQAYRCAYTLTGTLGRLHLDRAFTCPASRQPVIEIERQDHREQLTLPADDHFANTVAEFSRMSRTRAGLDDQRAELTDQAELLARVRAAATVVHRVDVTAANGAASPAEEDLT